jgi:hypothetical protein
VPDEIELTFRSGVSDADREAVNASVSGQVVARYDLQGDAGGIHAERLHVSGDLCSALDKLQRDSRVAGATPVLYSRTTGSGDGGDC